jgi:hypothetical protein
LWGKWRLANFLEFLFLFVQAKRKKKLLKIIGRQSIK